MRYVSAMIGMLGLFAVACGSGKGNDNGNGGTGGNGSGGADLSAAASDLSTSAADLAPLKGCKSLAACIDGCSDFGCANSCRSGSTQMAQVLYFQVLGCVRRVCYPHPDGGAAPCSQGGGGSGACAQCQKDVIAQPGSCTGGGEPSWCGACASQYAACEADTP